MLYELDQTLPRQLLRFPSLLRVTAVSLALALAACGGGGGGGGGGGDNTAPQTNSGPVAVPDNTFGVDCDGSGCGAIDASTYAGSDVGIWRYRNTTAMPASVPVGLSGTLGRTVTLVLTNEGDSSAPLSSFWSPNIAAQSATADGSGSADSTESTDADEPVPGVNQIPDRIRHFQPPAREPEEPGPARSIAGSSAPLANTVGSSRNWYDHRDASHTATLRIQRTAYDGRRINFWLENGEDGPGEVTNAQLTALADAFASGDNAIYRHVTRLIGQPWGSHPYGNLIPASQPIDIVLLNLTPDSAPWGLVGFFWGRNNYRQSSEVFSNESLSFYLDTETLYLDSQGLYFETSTLAHELVHMINFYQRTVVRSQQQDYSFDTWLEETSALMMEDIVGLKFDPDYHVIRDDRFPGWLHSGDFNCDITDWEDDPFAPCFGYNLGGSFGAWLLRHYGIAFYQSLLTSTTSTDSVALLDNAIRAAGGPGFDDAIRRWGTLLALLPANASPGWFGLPQRTELGFTLPAIHGPAYALVRRLPVTSPGTLVPNGHYPRQESNVADPYVRTVNVPAFTTLTVIVQ